MDTKIVYAESCNNYRHYSNLSLNIRVILATQGILILSAAGALTIETHYFFSIFSSIFGIILSISLFFIYINYQKACESFIRDAISIERNSKIGISPMDHHNTKFEERTNRLLGNILYNKGIFLLLMVSHVIVIIYSICHCDLPPDL